ncbi:staygreen family protein [Oscillibacter sp.]|uniref:staygreen family protein n=1 Tax=Oscillibacter sp. TaxID=1945593 RepID=UPI0028AEE462|nr:staygreen family protein [Oscillibacter sp.]
MRQLNPEKVFAQYRDIINPYEPVVGRKYTVTHSDATADLFVFIASSFAEDQVTRMHDDVKIGWEQTDRGLALIGSVIVDGEDVQGNPNNRNRIFLTEMPIALQALRHADRFLFDNNPAIDRASVLIHFISSDPSYDKTYTFGEIGYYK